MRYGTEATAVEIPVHGFLRDADFVHAVEDLVDVGLTLGAPDDLTDAGEKDVHGADGLAVFVLLHVEGLDLLRVVGQDDRLLEVFLDEVTLVLRLLMSSSK